MKSLQLFVTQIEGTLNSRHLTPLSDDPNDLSVPFPFSQLNFTFHQLTYSLRKALER